MMGKWLKTKMPGTFGFFVDFFGGLHNRPGGHSLRKLLAVGFFWLVVVLCLRYTDKTNLVTVIGILTAMITTLIVTYSVSNIKEKGMEQGKSPDSKSEENG